MNRNLMYPLCSYLQKSRRKEVKLVVSSFTEVDLTRKLLVATNILPPNRSRKNELFLLQLSYFFYLLAVHFSMLNPA